MSNKYAFWAILNKRGLELWGEVFPDGVVPVKSMIPRTGFLGDANKVEQFYMVDWGELTKDQQDVSIKKICDKLGGRPVDVKKQIAKDQGLPLRVNLTNGSGTSRPQLFL